MSAGRIISHEVDVVDGSALVSDDFWTVAGRTFTSRLIVGTGKYADYAVNAAVAEAAGDRIEIVAFVGGG